MGPHPRSAQTVAAGREWEARRGAGSCDLSRFQKLGFGHRIKLIATCFDERKLAKAFPLQIHPFRNQIEDHGELSLSGQSCHLSSCPA
jgi:hypothetical protein